jgi:hypothetical protein
MSGHTNRNRRNGGNPRARHNQQRQRGPDNRPGQQSQPKNTAPPSAEQESQANEQRLEQKPEQKHRQPLEQRSEQKPERESNRPRHVAPPPAQSATQAYSPVLPSASQPPSSGRETEPLDEPQAPVERHESVNPRGRAPFAAASRGGHAYIPASGPRMGVNGQNGQNGHHSGNGHIAAERHVNAAFMASDVDSNDDDDTGTTPTTWRIERLNGGSDTTPREPFRPESRGDVGSLIDTLHDLFAQDRAVASQGGSARCGICYLHFPLSALEYREAEGFYVCSGCKRALGHTPLTMIRRQQPPHAG